MRYMDMCYTVPFIVLSPEDARESNDIVWWATSTAALCQVVETPHSYLLYSAYRRSFVLVFQWQMTMWHFNIMLEICAIAFFFREGERHIENHNHLSIVVFFYSWEENNKERSFMFILNWGGRYHSHIYSREEVSGRSFKNIYHI